MTTKWNFRIGSLYYIMQPAPLLVWQQAQEVYYRRFAMLYGYLARETEQRVEDSRVSQ